MTRTPPDDAPTSVREEHRARQVATIPRWYNPWVHLGLTTAVGCIVLIAGMLRIAHVTALQLLTVPLVLLAANAIEWRAHRDLLHHRVRPFGILYDRHTPLHHKIYTYDDMSIRSTRELRLVLIPAVGVAVVVMSAAPMAFACGWVLGANVGWLVLMTSAAYVVAYEWSHMSYHLPPTSAIGRMGLVRVLREHHRRHHHPKLMQRWNFNVTIPLWDWVRGTSVSDRVLEQITHGAPAAGDPIDASTDASRARGYQPP